MFIELYYSKLNTKFFLRKYFLYLGFLILLLVFPASKIYSQISAQAQYFSPQTNQNSMRGASVFRQEIARMEITVSRAGKEPLSLTQVPRVQKDDVIKLRLLDEAVNGIKIDQTQWNWTLLVAFINPLHRMIDSENDKTSKDKLGTVSEEIQFRKRGWYREYSFVVPYDSQPVFFLYPKPKYRSQLVKVVNRKYEEIRKLGEKTIELADAYSKINTFVNEMQTVLNRNAQMLGYNNPSNSLTSNPYGSTYNPYNPYGSTYNPYNPYGTTPTTTVVAAPNVPIFGLPAIPALNQMVEGLAKSFNIQLPSCWGNGSNYNSGFGSTYGGSTYGSGLGYGNGNGNSLYGSGYGNNTAMMDFISRSQCVAKTVSLQDFDISVTRMWQQGGVFLAAELQRKFPQLAYYINIAAVAIDFIVKVFQKSPLRIVPTIIQSNDSQGGFNNNNALTGNTYGSQLSYGYSNNPPTASTNNPTPSRTPVKISLFADSQPSEGEFTTAYPVVVHKWQANADPEVISLYPPVLSESCLHTGTNILKSVDLTNQWSEDVYSRDFRIVMSSSNGFRKEFPVRKNMGLGGWELNISPEDMNQIPKINMALESELIGTRGFNEIKSPKFSIPVSLGGTYEITPESQKAFSVGGKRTVTLRNTLGSCRCLQRVIYKPSFGGHFTFENSADPNSPNNLIYSSDGGEVSFEIDTTSFQPGPGTLEIKTFGGETQLLQMGQTAPQSQKSPNELTLKLYSAAPTISDVRVGRGDREILITGERLEQIQSVFINGKRALIKGNSSIAQPVAIVEQNVLPNQNNTPAQSSALSQWGAVSQSTPTVTSIPSGTSAAVIPVAAPSTTSSQYQNIAPNQRVAVLEDTYARINSKTIMLELNLEDNRNFNYPNQFTVGVARPMIQANNQNEIEGIFLKQPLPNSEPETSEVSEPLKTKSKVRKFSEYTSQIDLNNYSVVPIDKSAMTVAVQNILTDYSFRNENLSIETRIENATSNPAELPGVTFDVLDASNLRLNFTFNRTVNKNLSGRRLQFRIVDRERGNSDWYSIKQTFIRIPQIESVVCTNEMNNQCELKGEGLDYISQVSTDGGRNWFPQSAAGSIQVHPTEDGKAAMKVPFLINQKFLQIKLRDYPQTEGLIVSGFRFSNTVKKFSGKILQSGNSAPLPPIIKP